MVRLDRAAKKLLALASTMGVMGALTVTTAGPAAAASSTGPRHQAIVALATDGPVTVPGLDIQVYLAAVHAEIVNGTPAQLAQLAATPGVVGIEANAKVHLQSDSFADNSSKDGKDAKDNSSDAESGADGVLVASTIGGKAGRSQTGRGVTIALIDTGVTDTAALNRASGRLVDSVDTSGLNSETGRIREHGVFADSYGHGTFMASLIAGGQVAGSGKLGLGIAPGATVDVVKVADADGSTSLGAVMAALNWVATHSDEVDVANLSLSVDQPSETYGIDPLNFAVSLTRSSGVTVVVAAGNTPGMVGDPGFGPASLTVGAADTTGNEPSLASFSGYANVDGVIKPDVVAAGVNILGAMPSDSLISRQYPAARQATGLFRGSGTSQSTAVVSGLAAMYLQTHHKATPSQVKAAIRRSASSIAAGKTDGQGLVSAPEGDLSLSNLGESSLDTAEWLSTAPQWGDLFTTSGVFDARLWGARLWNADGWDARMWAGVEFDARLWSARLWSSRLWADGTFDARLWSARMWSARMWSSRMWAAASWGDAS